MLFAPALYRNGPVTSEFRSGQVEDTHERDLPITEDQTAGNTTLSADKLISGFVVTSGAAVARTLTLPSADQIVAALRGSFGVDSPPSNSPFDSAHNAAPEKEFPSNLGVIHPGASFRFAIRNDHTGTGALTIAAGTGVTVTGGSPVAITTWREWLLKVKNSTPTVVGSVSTTNASKVLSNVSAELLNKVTVGMLATGTGIGAAPNRVMAVNRDARTITLDVNSTATADNIAVTFTPEVVFTSLRGGAA